MSVDLMRAVAELGEAQWGVFTLADLIGLGLTASAVRKRVGAGTLYRLYQCVYGLVPAELLTRNGRWLAAVYACGPGAVLSHRTAAALHDLRRTDGTRIDVTVPGRHQRRHPGIRSHRSLTLTDADITIVEGIRCTTIARTQLDLAEVIPRRSVERALDQAESMDAFDLTAIQDQLERNATRKGARVIRSVLAEHYVGSTVSWSELEEQFLATVRRHGLPAPELNRFIDFGDGGPAVRADFVWRAHKILVEADGFRTHRTRQAFEYDRRVSQRAMVAGWRPVRTTKRQVERQPDQIVATVATLCATGSAAGNRDANARPVARPRSPPGVPGSPAAGDGRAPARAAMRPGGGRTASVRPGDRSP